MNSHVSYLMAQQRCTELARCAEQSRLFKEYLLTLRILARRHCIATEGVDTSANEGASP